MTNIQQESLKKSLLKLKKSIEEELFIKYQYENNIEKYQDDEDNQPSDEADLAAQANIIALETKRQLLLKKKLNEVNIALNKIENNIYGICEESGEPIELKRLLANPTARFCFEIQKLLEKGY